MSAGVMPSACSKAMTLLRENPVFAVCSLSGLTELARQARIVRADAGAKIFSETSPATSLYVLALGAVRVFHRDAAGQETTVKHLLPPTTFGEMELLSGEPLFLESTETMAPTCYVVIPATAFMTFIDAEPKAARALLNDVSARFCVAARNEHSLFFEVPARLASLLLSYAEIFGEPLTDGIRIHHPLTQESLADGLGVVVRSVARALTTWQRAGIVVRRRGWVVIRDKAALETASQGLRFNLNYRFAPDKAKA
jgi:CRP-like cAMP-binding protein